MQTSPDGTAVLYARVSTEKQEDEGTSLEAQVEELAKAAAAEGLVVRAVFSGAESGKLELADRPVLQACIQALRKGDTLYIHRVDRLSRDMRTSEEAVFVARKLGAHLRILNVPGTADDPFSQFMRQVLAAAAQLDRANIVARTTAGKRRSVAAGGRWGGTLPLGQRMGPKGPEVHPEEAANVERMRAALAKGHSYRWIRENIPGRNGKKMSFSTIRKVVASCPAP